MNTNNYALHQIIALCRSKSHDETIVVRVLKILVKVVMLGYALLTGFFLDQILLQAAPNCRFSQSLLCFAVCGCILDLCVKLIFKTSHINNVIPYMTLPIRRKKVFAMSQMSHFLSVFNFIGFVIFFSLFIKMAIKGSVTFEAAIVYSLFTLVVSLLNSASVRFAKSFVGIRMFACLLVVCIPHVLLTYSIFYADKIEVICNAMGNLSLMCILVVLIGFVSYVLSYMQCRQEFYRIMESKDLSQSRVLRNLMGSLQLSIRLNPISRLVMLMTMRNKSMMISLAVLEVMSLGYLVMIPVKGNLPYEYYLSLWAVFSVTGPIMICNPFTYFLSYSFDGLYANVDELVYKVAHVYRVFFALISIIITAIGIAITQEWMLFTTCYMMVFPVEFIYLRSVLYGTKRIDVFRSFTDSQAIDLKVFLGSGLVALCFLGSFIALYVYVSKDIVCVVYSSLSLLFLLTSGKWLRTIFLGFMKRRYDNMSGFRGEYQ